MTGSSSGSPFLAACRGEPHAHTPVWFMRQAGRSLPEYRARRGAGNMQATLRQPDLAAEITLQPVRRYGVDAAILYSDIMVPVEAIGFGVEITPGIGPVVAEPFAAERDLARLRPLEPDVDVPFVAETVRILTRELPVPLIGFAGAPFTVASYLIEGRPSREYARTKAMMLGDPPLFGRLLDRLADLALASARAQVEAGAAAVQLFDSWVGALTPDHYRRHVLPHSTKVLPGPALQGNLDPAVCFAPWAAVEEAALDVLRRNAGHPGHVFNLGHGVLPSTDPDTLARLVELVHGWRPT